MDTPKISVLIPVCNVESYIEQCLRSVMKQTMQEIEIICIDDGSKDNSLAIMQCLAQEDDRITIINKENSGYGNSMNIGLSRATGQYIAIVESDDFVVPHMMDDLWELTNHGTVDVVKGNFWDYYETDEKTEAVINTERWAINGLSRIFTISEEPGILWGHPSVWSAIYRRDFLEQHHIRFIEAPGGGWVDNPFFFETLLKAKSIRWTQEPYYYYRKTNPNSSSNRQPDLTLPLRRMLDNLDIVEQCGYQDEETLKLVYSRSLMYLYGVFSEKDYATQMTEVKRYARILFKRLNHAVIDNNFNLRDQNTYYTYLSPIDAIVPNRPKLLIYNWVQFDNPPGWGGGVNVYCRNLIDTILSKRPDVDIYFLSSGLVYDASCTNCYVRSTRNIYGERVRTFEIVNSPVPSAQNMIINNTSIALESPELKKVLFSFLARSGPFEAIHFNNIEGLSLDCLDLKKEFPNTRMIFSLHNYVPFCTHGFYFNRVTHKNCVPNHSLEDCIGCTECGRRSDISLELYKRSTYVLPEDRIIPREEWIQSMGFACLDHYDPATNLLSYSQKAVAVLNSNMDLILAVSDRVGEIAIANGMCRDKVQTSYIGTKVASYAMQNHAEGIKGKYFKLAYLGSDIHVVEKGYKFLMEFLSNLDPSIAGKMDLFLTTTNGNKIEMKRQLSHFHQVTIKKGYRHNELRSMLRDVDLGVIPVLWEDNLPQIAIEMAAMGVPVLASSFGGASELCDSELFRFQGGSMDSFREHLVELVEHPEKLGEYWKHSRTLTTLEKHWEEMEALYQLPAAPESLTLTFEDYQLIIQENTFLRKVSYMNNSGQSDSIYRDFDAMRNSVSFRIGRVITYVPRMIRKVYRYFKDFGWKHTRKKIGQKLRRIPPVS